MFESFQRIRKSIVSSKRSNRFEAMAFENSKALFENNRTKY